MCERTETMAIETVHLRLEPYASERLLALIEGDESFGERFGLPAALSSQRYETRTQVDD